MQSWEYLGHKRDSNYWQANNVFWQDILACVAKICSNIARIIKSQDGVLLSNEDDILGKWREFFKDLLNLVTLTLSVEQDVYFREVNTRIATEIFSAVKTLKGWEGCRLWWNATWNAQSFEQRSYLANADVSSGLAFCKSGLRSRSRSRKLSKVFGWSRSRIPNNTGGRSRVLYWTPTPSAQLDHFLHHTPELGIAVEMVQFLLKLLLNQKFLAVYHDFHWF